MQFIVGQDPKSQIFYENNLKQLPPGCYTHKILDKVIDCVNYLNDIKENFNIFFAEELLEAVDYLDSEQFGEIFENLNNGMQKAFDHFKKLEGNSGQSFARSFRYIILKQPWINAPNEDEIRYDEELHNYITNFNINDFG
ncbi:8970_t:CDS:2, partial [Funneliformis mosseae]